MYGLYVNFKMKTIDHSCIDIDSDISFLTNKIRTPTI